MKSYKNKKLNIYIPEILSIRKTLIFKEDTNDVKNNNFVINIDKCDNKVEKQHTFISLDENSQKENYENQYEDIEKIDEYSIVIDTNENSKEINTNEYKKSDTLVVNHI